ncbi:hypothetical protein LMG23992_00771 [Cupriavidus laharis]|uniref:Uncharacterized protein n=1 Tax=Cupriavidus laharis TaxID=151654 RepID=A0ABM8WIQ2_9BURK|nr:hypothetical protein LMG23992_00771 [Cupriavidus laharis]
MARSLVATGSAEAARAQLLVNIAIGLILAEMAGVRSSPKLGKLIALATGSISSACDGTAWSAPQAGSGLAIRPARALPQAERERQQQNIHEKQAIRDHHDRRDRRAHRLLALRRNRTPAIPYESRPHTQYSKP